MMGSQKGTLMEVGISPTMYSSILMMVIMPALEFLGDTVSAYDQNDMLEMLSKTYLLDLN